jgi:hypothetical protein
LFQFGRASAPIAPETVQTMRGPNVGTGLRTRRGQKTAKPRNRNWPRLPGVGGCREIGAALFVGTGAAPFRAIFQAQKIILVDSGIMLSSHLRFSRHTFQPTDQAARMRTPLARIAGRSIPLLRHHRFGRLRDRRLTLRDRRNNLRCQYAEGEIKLD